MPTDQKTALSLGDRLLSLREAAKLSQMQLAQKARLTQSAISRIESGLRSPRVAEVRALARALGVQPADLFGA